MDWHILALLAPIFFALAKFFDKYLVEQRFRNPSLLPVIESGIWALIGIPVWAYTGFALMSRTETLIALYTGFTLIWAANLYWKGIARADTSTFIILIQMQPVMILILSYLTLGEVITPLQLVGFVVIIAAAIGVALQREGGVGRLRLSAAMWPVLLFSLVIAVNQVLTKYAVESAEVLPFMAFEQFGVGLGGLSIFLTLPRVRRDVIERVRTLTWLDVEVMVIKIGFVLMVARLLLISAIALGPVSLVRAFVSTQIFWGVFMGWLFSRWGEAIFKENVTRPALMRKAGFAVVMFTGVLMAA